MKGWLMIIAGIAMIAPACLMAGCDCPGDCPTCPSDCTAHAGVRWLGMDAKDTCERLASLNQQGDRAFYAYAKSIEGCRVYWVLQVTSVRRYSGVYYCRGSYGPCLGKIAVFPINFDPNMNEGQFIVVNGRLDNIMRSQIVNRLQVHDAGVSKYR